MTDYQDPPLDSALHRLRNAMASVDIARSLLAQAHDSDQAAELGRILTDAADELQQHADRVVDRIARITDRRHRSPPQQ